MATDWDFVGPPEPSSFDFASTVKGFTDTVTSLIGSAASIKNAATSSGLVSGNQTRQDDSTPATANDKTILYLMIGVGIVWLIKRG